MDDTTQQPLSRRQWLGLVTTASAALAATDASGQTPAATPAPVGVSDLGSRIYNIRDYGAKGDGATPDTAALQAAIDACTGDKGGTVMVPAGVFVIGTVELKNNVILHIAPGGKLLGSLDPKQYHAADAIPLHGDTTLNDGNVALIFAVKAENIIVEGPGTIDGRGAQFHRPAPGIPSPVGVSSHQRPYHMLFYQCNHVRVRDIHLVNCAYHSIRVAECQLGWFTGIEIFSRVNSNNDGFHFISCEHMQVSDCTVICEDDACAMFGSCKWFTITNCTFSTRWSVFRFGGGTSENIAISNCLIYETYGCPIKMRGEPNSHFSNISFSNLVMQNVTGPISIGLGEWPEEAGGTPASIKNISFNGIHAVVSAPQQLPDSYPAQSHNPGEVLSCITLNGVKNAIIENIDFNDVHIIYPGGGTAEQGAVRNVPEVVTEYYGLGVPPAYGIYARNVKGLTMQDVRFEMESPDLRPALVFDHVTDAAINGLSAQGVPGAESLMRFMESQDILVTAARVLTPAAVFLRVEGADTKNLKVEGGDLSKATAPLALADEVKKESVKVRS